MLSIDMLEQLEELSDILDDDPSEKSIGLAYALFVLGGVFGLHHFYLKHHFLGILYLMSGGLAGIGLIIDFFTLPIQVYCYNNGD